jgi:hypothetical protein
MITKSQFDCLVRLSSAIGDNHKVHRIRIGDENTYVIRIGDCLDLGLVFWNNTLILCSRAIFQWDSIDSPIDFEIDTMPYGADPLKWIRSVWSY